MGFSSLHFNKSKILSTKSLYRPWLTNQNVLYSPYEGQLYSIRARGHYRLFVFLSVYLPEYLVDGCCENLNTESEFRLSSSYIRSFALARCTDNYIFIFLSLLISGSYLSQFISTKSYYFSIQLRK